MICPFAAGGCVVTWTLTQPRLIKSARVAASGGRSPAPVADVRPGVVHAGTPRRQAIGLACALARRHDNGAYAVGWSAG